MLEFDARKLFPRWYELGEDLKQTLKVVKLSQLVPPEVPIRPLDPEHVEELKKSIRSVGLVQPLLVTYGEEGKYTVLDGQHRLKALSEIAEETQKHPSEVPVTVVVLHTENQNARYGLILAAYQANRHHWRMGLPSLEEALTMVRAAFGQGGEDAFRQGLDFLRGLKAEDLEALLSVLLESSPVEALPVPDGPEQGFWKEAKKLSTGFRASLYLLEGVAEGNLPGFLRRLLSSTPPRRTEKKEEGPAPEKPLLELPGFTRGSEVKRYVALATRTALREVRGIRLNKQALASEEVSRLLEILRELLALLRKLKDRSAVAKASDSGEARASVADEVHSLKPPAGEAAQPEAEETREPAREDRTEAQQPPAAPVREEAEVPRDPTLWEEVQARVAEEEGLQFD